MPTPPKPFKVLEAEGKSHRTAAELKARREAEASTITGEKIKESKAVRENKIAHNYFKRAVNLLEKIEKNDAIYENIINRYCLLNAEVEELQERENTSREAISKMIEQFEEFVSENVTDSRERACFLNDFAKNMAKLENSIDSIDRKIQSRRTAIYNIEKECYMTPAAALRSIPKKEPEKENPLKKILSG